MKAGGRWRPISPEVVYRGECGWAEKLLSSKEAATLLGIAVDEDSLIPTFYVGTGRPRGMRAPPPTAEQAGFRGSTLHNAPNGATIVGERATTSRCGQISCGAARIDARLYEFYARRVQTRSDHSRHLMDYLSLRAACKEDRLSRSDSCNRSGNQRRSRTADRDSSHCRVPETKRPPSLAAFYRENRPRRSRHSPPACGKNLIENIPVENVSIIGSAVRG